MMADASSLHSFLGSFDPTKKAHLRHGIQGMPL